MSFLTWISGGSGEQERGNNLDAQLAQLNARDYSPGGKLYTPENWDRVQRQQASGQTVNVDAEIAAAFKEGLDDGAKNVTGFLGGAFDIVGKGVGAILKAVPWWIWAAALLYILITTGLLGPLVRKATGR
jgi:hypothetical protein